MLKYDSFRSTIKYVIIPQTSKLSKKKSFIFSSSIRMNGKRIIFDDKKSQKSSFYKNKKLFNIHDIDINKKLVWKKERHGTNKSFKYFFGYNDNNDIRPLCRMIPQMIAYVKRSV